MKNVLKSIVLLVGCLLVSFRADAESVQSPIVQLGPAGGVVTCIKGTADDRLVLIGIRDHGIFRSTDGGQSWTSVFMERMQANAGSVNDIVFAGENPLVAYAATDWGLYKTTDGGASWNLTAFSLPTKCIAVHPLNSDVLFFGDAAGVKRSIDGGMSFMSLQENFGFITSIIALAIDPFTAASKDSLCVVAATDSFGFFRSLTGGITWESFNAGLESPADDRYKHVRSLSVIRDTSSTITFAAGTLQGPVVYREGALRPDQWIKIPAPVIGGSFDGIIKTASLVTEGTSTSIYIGLCSYDWNGLARPVGNGLLYTTLGALFYGNPNLTPLLTFPYGVDVFSLFVPDSNRAKVYVASSAGLLVSNNSGNGWLPQDVTNSGLNFAMVRNVGIIQNMTKKFIFAGTFGGGVYRSQDEGKNWERVSKGITNPYICTIATDPKNDRTLYAASVYNIYKSIDGGDTWKELLQGGYVRNSGAFNNTNEVTLRVSPVNSNNLLMEAAAFGLQGSTDGGTTWEDCALPGVAGKTPGVENIEFDPEDAQIIYFACRGFYRSMDFGKTWNNLSGDLPRILGNDSIRYLSPTFTPGNKNQIYLCSTLDVSGIQASIIYRTTTGGGTWLPLNVQGVDISIDRVDPSFLFASGPDGIFHSSDAGKNWIRLSDPDPRLPITYLAISDDPLNSNVQYIGSDQGASRLDYGVLPKLTVPTAFDFGLRPLGSTSDTSFVLSNKSGAKRVLVQLVLMLDTTRSFLLKDSSSSSASSFVIEAGAELTLQMSFTPQSAGRKNAYLTFQTTDPNLPFATVEFHGNGLAHHFTAKTEYDFGTVLVGKDTTLSLPISNREGSSPAVIRVLTQSQPSIFVLSVQEMDSIVIPAGRDTLLRIRFVPPSQGLQQGTLAIGVNDEGYAAHLFTLQGAGFLRTLFSKRVLLDNLHGFASPFDTSAKSIETYFSTMLASLTGAGIVVARPKQILATSGYDAVLIAGPQQAYTSAEIDSLQSYVNGGGLLVMMGNSSSEATGILNALLTDTAGVKWKSDPGMHLEQTLVTDPRKPLPKTPIAPLDVVPVRTGPYFAGADQLQFFGSTLLTLKAERADTMLVADSPVLLLPSGDTLKTRAVVGAVSPVGSGKIFLLADLDCWSNDIEVGKGWEMPFGLLAKKNLQFALNVFGSKENFDVTLPTSTPKEEYRIISIPYNLSDTTATSVFKDLGPIDPMSWRLFGQWDAAAQRYMEFPTDFQSIARGLGYWLITRGEKNLNFGLANVSAAQDTFSITLQPGWNLIGNPFPYKVSWANSFHPFTERALWKFTGKGYVMDSVFMEPFVGYFVKSLDTIPSAVKISPIPVEALAKTVTLASTLRSGEWMMRVSVSNGSAFDADNYAGVREDAKNEWDALDISEPPTNPSGYVALSFLDMQWKRNAGRYAVDFRGPVLSGAYWDVEVRSDQPGKNIIFSCEKIGSYPGGFGTYLVDMKTERVYDAASGYTFTLKNGESARLFRLVAGTEEYVRQHTNGIPLTPVEYALEQNFPNPFNPSTEIRYALSHSGMVRLDVVNVLGQKVKTLVQQAQPIGHYQVTWDGTTDAGTGASSGVYFYRLTTEGFSSVRRLVLIR